MYQDFKSIFSDDNNRKKLGYIGEKIVVAYLQNNDFVILEKNYQKRFGEIDIIARKNDVIAFIEVKFRKKEYFQLSQVVTYSKQRKIIHTAKAFIIEHAVYNVLYRFDIALVTYDINKKPHVTYIENAFTDTASE